MDRYENGKGIEINIYWKDCLGFVVFPVDGFLFYALHVDHKSWDFSPDDYRTLTKF